MSEPRSLGQFIDAQIALSGPLGIAAYMQLCLTHPTLGYYVTRHPFGTEGDFTTAPEISQMFGEMVGAWIAETWLALGSPPDCDLVEFGPGRGTLMADALRILARLPGAVEGLHLTLVEASPALAAEQRTRLAGHDLRHVADLDALGPPARPLIVIANEFLDALPIRQLQKRGAAWHEREIGLVDGKRQFGLSPTPLPGGLLPPELAGAGDHEIWETRPAAERLVEDVAARLAQAGGAALIIDYGYLGPRTGDTLQAVRAHAFADVLAEPGAADLTAHVDFAPLLAIAGRTGLTTGFATQAEFLAAMGIAGRAEKLIAANPGRAEELRAALHRLTDPAAMGDLFKVMTIGSK